MDSVQVFGIVLAVLFFSFVVFVALRSKRASSEQPPSGAPSPPAEPEPAPEVQPEPRKARRGKSRATPGA